MKYRVTGKQAGLIWDKDKNEVLAKFANGVFETEDKEKAAKLEALGYKVESEGEESEDAPEEEPASEVEEASKEKPQPKKTAKSSKAAE